MKLKYKNIGVIAAGIATGVLLTLIYTSYPVDQHSDNANNDSRLLAIEKNLSDLQQAIENEQPTVNVNNDADIENIKQQIAKLQLALESGQESLQTEGDLETPNVQENLLFTNPEEHARIAIEQEMALRTTLEDNFANDDVSDVEWAQNTQNDIENAFQGEKLLGSALVSSDCKSNICKLEITPDLSTVDGDMDMYQNELLVALAGSLNSSALRVEKNTDGSPRIIGYFGKRGASLTKPRSDSNSVSGLE